MESLKKWVRVIVTQPQRVVSRAQRFRRVCQLRSDVLESCSQALRKRPAKHPNADGGRGRYLVALLQSTLVASSSCLSSLLKYAVADAAADIHLTQIGVLQDTPKHLGAKVALTPTGFL